MTFAGKPCHSALALKALLVMLVGVHSGLARAVSTADCAEEQATYVEAYVNSIISPESQKAMRDRGNYVQERVGGSTKTAREKNIPWHVDDANKVKSKDTLTAAIAYHEKEILRNQEMADSFKTTPWAGMSDRRFPFWVYMRNVTELRMENCFFAVRSRELSGQASTSPATPDCENAEAANREMNEIEEKVGAFRESPAGQQTTVATPAMQTVMWATESQAKIIRKYCAASPGFKERLAELDTAFKSAQQACRQIQSQPEVCIGVAPQ
ncbi:MAG TPA: hypothetical protein VF050_02355 [Moraxellaceae bacterium]